MRYDLFLGSGIFMSAFTTSDFFGKLIFLGLFAVSGITWLVLIQKAFLFKNVRRESNKFQEVILKDKENLLATFSDLPYPFHETPSPFIHIYLSLKTKTTELLEKNDFFQKSAIRSEEERRIFLSREDIDLIEDDIQMIISQETKSLEKNLFILSTAVSLAPFLGILGTVWGILISLGDLKSGGALHSNSIVLGGLSTALATTVLGLFIAIPALIAHNYLRNSLRNFHGEMEGFSHSLLSTIELQYRKVDFS